MKRIDPRQHRSIDKLHKAYLTLVREESTPLTIQMLCNEANVTRPTFYKQFKDIAELKYHLHDTLLRKLKQSLTIVNPKPLSELQQVERSRYLTALFEHIYENHSTYETLLVEQADSRFINHMKSVLHDYIDEGITYTGYHHQLRVERPLVISFISGAYIESITWWIQHHYPYTPTQMAAQLIDLSIYGPYNLHDE
ncbi:TetR/AcrR family transcriptional regulator [Geomicrobium sp. JCM 19038]|uniref:TetR/AcrR family transcriptional regulator n=1 Tax=Geomicrobium sp. JCM 19038 TaxID=1460635 RepID=UPI00045F484F|nr:TetR/AcrR family transcriptional regulator [Geomicrobium sp. JCM 19038]GAK06766.1 transcriptional regulator, TetR family [Geomicrobium sp. JCM 19038]